MLYYTENAKSSQDYVQFEQIWLVFPFYLLYPIPKDGFLRMFIVLHPTR